MDKKQKPEETSQLRQPKAKTNKFGLKVPLIRMPHEDLIKPEQQRLEIVPPIEKTETLPTHTRQTSQSTHTRQTSHTRQPSHTTSSEIAPTKNFQKVANSISKQAVPDGWFKGKSKQLYDALYTLTRGAITPTRKVRIQKSKLMKLAAIGSRITFDSNIQHLISVGLIIEKVFTGEHEGNEFEIFLPEEATLTSMTSQSRLTSHAQKVDRLVSLETGQTSQSINIEDSITSGFPKTLFKTNTNDDEAFAKFIEILNEAAVELTGKKLGLADQNKLQDLAELLVLELRSAARRTGAISNVPAFLTEVLRRKLLSQQTPKVSKVKTDTIGKSEAEQFEIKPLDEQGKEAALAELGEFAGDDFLEDFKKWYTEEDWQWLKGNLEISKTV